MAGFKFKDRCSTAAFVNPSKAIADTSLEVKTQNRLCRMHLRASGQNMLRGSVNVQYRVSSNCCTKCTRFRKQLLV